MNKFVKISVLTLAALATVATSIQIADAGERNWKKRWHKRNVVVGVTAGVVAGAVIASRPRVVYRDAPIIVEGRSVYDREMAYDEDDTIYADPDQAYGRQYYSEDEDDTEEYAAPSDDRDYGYNDQAGLDDNYFPDRPAARADRNKADTRRAVVTDAQPRKVAPVRQANAAGIQPWTKEWRTYCTSRFASFNPQNGTYLGYDQKRHFCKAG
jgi:hypothetical protein